MRVNATTRSSGAGRGRRPDVQAPESRLAQLAAILQLSKSDTKLLVKREPKLLDVTGIKRWHQSRIQALCTALDAELPVVVDKVVRPWPQCLLLATQALAKAPASVAKRLDISEDDAKARLLEEPGLMQPSPRAKELRELGRMQAIASLIRAELGVEPSAALARDFRGYTKQAMQTALTLLIQEFGRERSARWLVQCPDVLKMDPKRLPLRVQQLAAVLQLPVDEALPIIDGCPKLLSFTPGLVEARLQALCSALEVDKAVAVQQVIQYRPWYLRLPADRLASSVVDLANARGMTLEAARSRMLGNPSERRQALQRERAERQEAMRQKRAERAERQQAIQRKRAEREQAMRQQRAERRKAIQRERARKQRAAMRQERAERQQAMLRERAEGVKATLEAELGIQLSDWAVELAARSTGGDVQAKVAELVARYGRERITSWVRYEPQLLTLDPGRIHQRLLHAVDVLGMDESQVLLLVDKAPEAMLLSSNLGAKVQALSDALGVEVGVVQAMVRSYPKCIGLSVKKLQKAPAALAQVRGISVEAARQVLKDKPYLLRWPDRPTRLTGKYKLASLRQGL